jgi:hypothetical protein
MSRFLRFGFIPFIPLILLFIWLGCGEDDKTTAPAADTTQPSSTTQPTNTTQPIVPKEQPQKLELSFAKDILPIFNANCAFAGCHGANPPSGLFLTNYDSFKKGGVSGPAFIAGNSKGSLIIKRIKPGGGMPQGRPALKKEEIQKISDWIDEGGKNN